MTALSRRNSLWLSLMLALAMVLTIGGAPAYAMACAEMSRPVAAPAASEKMAGCHEATETRSCCCPPARSGIQSVRQHQQPPVSALLTQSGCGCAIQSQPAVPASSQKATTLVLAQDLAFLPGSPTALQLAAPAVWAYAVSANGPPQSDTRSSGPSRAPPAC